MLARCQIFCAVMYTYSSGMQGRPESKTSSEGKVNSMFRYAVRLLQSKIFDAIQSEFIVASVSTTFLL